MELRPVFADMTRNVVVAPVRVGLRVATTVGATAARVAVGTARIAAGPASYFLGTDPERLHAETCDEPSNGMTGVRSLIETQVKTPDI